MITALTSSGANLKADFTSVATGLCFALQGLKGAVSLVGACLVIKLGMTRADGLQPAF